MLPFLFRGEPYQIPMYFLVISIVSSLALWYAARRAERIKLDRTMALDLTFIVMIFGMIGARAFHVFFEYPEIYSANPMRVFHIWEGGFVFYGGALIGTAAGLAYLMIRKQKIARWLDLAAPVAALSYGLGRLGCFFAGCCYGKYCTLPWAIHFPKGGEAPSGLPLHPTQLYAVFWELALFTILVKIEKRRNSSVITKPGDLFFLWLMGHGLGRMIMELYRDDFRGGLLMGLTISTLISLLIVFLGVGLYLMKTEE